ncbi:acyltransferase family protein [Plantibacter sp. Mn2098]|uniref:acyltransferase family protein n=1 Tax=Plantibacter sp. Mn2098 TaxID=3395266 RepID=UPI003BBF451F
MSSSAAGAGAAGAAGAVTGAAAGASLAAVDRGADGVRTDIQGLRALAVTLVVVFHLWPRVLPGGYVGVDVFFVLSGFLITAHLLREAERTGGIRLGRFWARRARRLLPAALTVLVATVVGVWAFAPVGYVDRFLHEVLASTLYVENWVLAGSAVDYLAAEASASPVQHFWSLSVEEQFYLLWPVVLLAGVWIARRRGAPLRVVVGALLGAVVLASLVWSVVYTAADAAPAYFATTTRTWEFGAGGLLAVVAAGTAGRTKAPNGVRVWAAWIGVAAIVASAAAYSASTPFPGWTAALPVVGTLLVIWAAGPTGHVSPDRIFGLGPVRMLGDQSYAVYLWHWPIIVLGGFALGRDATLLQQLGMLVATGVLAAVTTRWIERPIRFGALSRISPARALAAAGAAMLVVVAVTVAGLPVAGSRVIQAQDELTAVIADPPACFGAAALAEAACATSDPDSPAGASSVPDPSLADDPPERCIAGTRDDSFDVCAYGAAQKDAVRTVALVGDSHAEQWLPAMSAVATAERWRVIVMTKSSCPFSDAVRTEPGMSAAVQSTMNDSCRRWNDETMRYLAAHREITTVLVAARGRNPVVPGPGETWRQTAEGAYLDRWAQVPSSVRHIVVLRDTPRMTDSTLACVRDAAHPAADCARARRAALEDDPQFDAALRATKATAVAPGKPVIGTDRVTPLDLSDLFCAAATCAPVVGGVLVYRDSHHLTWVYAATTAPTLANRLDAILSAR